MTVDTQSTDQSVAQQLTTTTYDLLTAQPQACAGLVLHVVFFLTAQPQACAGLVLHVVFFFFFFFSFVGELTKTSARPNAGQDI